MTSPLSRLKELEEKATAKPWRISAGGIVQTAHVTRDVWQIPRSDEDLELITALRNAAPHLLDALQKGEAWLKAEDQFNGEIEAANSRNWHPNYSDKAWDACLSARESFRAALAKLGEGK